MTILEAFENYGLSTRRKANNEWAAACPSCGGKDRCIIWPQHEKGTGGRYYCRQCQKGGDLIDFLQKFMGMSKTESWEKADLAGKELGYKQRRAVNKTISFPARYKNRHLPPDRWMQRAAKFLQDCQTDNALDCKEAVERINCDRFIDPAHCREFGIGWNDRDRYDWKENWGLDGQDKIRLPKGIVIATMRKIGIVSLLIRKVDNEQSRYWQVKGGAEDVPYIPSFGRNRPVILLESALDAALLACYARSLCTPIALGGTCKGIDSDTMAFIQAAPLIIASPDNDEAGRKAWPHWKEIFPSAWPYLAIKAKDIGDMHRLASTPQGVRDCVPDAAQWAQHATEYAKTRINALVSD